MSLEKPLAVKAFPPVHKLIISFLCSLIYELLQLGLKVTTFPALVPKHVQP